jgi:hypothetical protein
MRKAFIAFQVIVLIILIYLSWYLATDYQTPHGRQDMPFLIWVIDTLDLFMHEGGHGIFKIFGQFMYFLGGSLIQVIIPVAALIVFLRTSGLRSLIGTLYWLGHNLINISIYVADAPKQQLTLISRHAMHDWRWILGRMGMLDSAGDFAAVISFLGVVALVGAIGVGVYFIVHDVRDELQGVRPPETITP